MRAEREAWRSGRDRYRPGASLFVALVAMGGWLAQRPTQIGAQGITVQATPGGAVVVPSGAAGLPPGAVPPGAQPGVPPGAQGGAQPAAQPDGKPAEGTGDAAKDKPAEDNATTKRPTTPPQAPDPREFDVLPDENNRLSFNFHGQFWPHVLQWLASLDNHSLDWQELPNDFIHVASNRKMSVPEIRDLFNRLLFERGFTLVLQDNVLLVLKLDKLDPSLLRRIEDEAELLDLPAHEFVKITFRLPEELKADKAAEDIKPLLSRFAKVQPLMATNRLLVIDLVSNLREVSHLVNAEHAAATGRIVPREFTIRYARADQVADQVMILLGLDPSSRRSPQELQVEQQRLQLFAQMQQQGRDVTKYLRDENAPVVFLAVNDRNNSLLVNAPPKDMSVIERAVSLLDIPGGMLTGAGSVPLSMKRYSLVTIKPESIVTALSDIGGLDPRSQVKIDSDAKVVFANATPHDHEKIQAMIDQLDGTGRQFDVIWLRRLPAESVATTIRNLMVGKEEKKDENSRGYIFYGYRDSQQEKEAPNQGFRIDADTRNNRLLLWANEAELNEVRSLLVKLGEIPGESGNPRTIRAFHAGDEESARDLIERLRRVWPSIQPNPLVIDPSLPSGRPSAAPSPAPSAAPSAAPADALPEDQPTPTQPPATIQNTGDHREARGSTRSPGPRAPDDVLAWVPRRRDESTQVAVGDAVAENGIAAPDMTTSTPPAPIQISIGSDGRLLLQSNDPRALDHLEELLERIAPARREFEVFYLKHASASLVQLNLEEYFEEDTKDKESDQDAWLAGWYGYGYRGDSSEGLSGEGGLSQRKPLRFIYDFDTNSILVANASPEQLATIRSLIEIYDRPISEESISARRYEIFKIRHARATDIATTIKDVYRDLLSSKDKVFERPTEGEKEQTSQGMNYIRLFGGNVDDKEKKPTKVKASFAGAVSVGVDEATNIVIVSAQEEWMPSIAAMIRYMDVAAEPNRDTVEVVNTQLSGKSLHAALNRLMSGDKDAGAKPLEGAEKPATQTPGGETPSKTPTAGSATSSTTTATTTSSQ